MQNYKALSALVNHRIVESEPYRGKSSEVLYAFCGDLLCISVKGEPWRICTMFNGLNLERLVLSDSTRSLPNETPFANEAEKKNTLIKMIEKEQWHWTHELALVSSEKKVKSLRHLIESLISGKVIVHDGRTFGVDLFTFSDDKVWHQSVLGQKHKNAGRVAEKTHSIYQTILTNFWEYEVANSVEEVSNLYDERPHLRPKPFTKEDRDRENHVAANLDIYFPNRNRRITAY